MVSMYTDEVICLKFCCYGFLCVPDDVTLTLLTESELERCILVPRAPRLFLNYITF